MRTTRASSFRRLVDYITSAQGKAERVGQISTTNLNQDDAHQAALEAELVQRQNTRSQADKTYHLVISFPAGETPSEAALRDIESKLCAGLGFAEHQRVSAVHHDTDNLHLHVAINKVHPKTLRTHTPYNDHKTLGRLCEALERDHGLQSTNHVTKQRASAGRARDMEQAAGEQSLIGWIRDSCGEQLQNAQTWEALHTVLAEHSLEIRERGNGLVIAARNGVVVKASSVSRTLSKHGLEGRLGAFEPVTATDPLNSKRPREYKKRPKKSYFDTSALYADYQAERASASDRYRSGIGEIRSWRQSEIARIKGRARTQRRLVKALKGSSLSKKILYDAISKRTKQELEKLVETSRDRRTTLLAKTGRPSWLDWLVARAAEGNSDALAALRARPERRDLVGNVLKGAATKQDRIFGAVDSVTKTGTVAHNTGQGVVRFDGARLKVPDAFTDATVKASLAMAQQRYGKRLNVQGSPAFLAAVIRAAATTHMDITFDNPAMEAKRLAIAQIHLRSKNHDRAHLAGRSGNAGIQHGRTQSDRSRRGGIRIAGDGIDSGKLRSRGLFVAVPGRTRFADIGSLAGDPAAAGRQGHSVRGLSELRLVQHTRRGEVLLPRDVHHQLEQQGTPANNELRRHIHRGGGLEPFALAKAIKAAIPKLGTAPPPAAKNVLRKPGAIQPLSAVAALSKIPEPARLARPAIPATKAKPSQPVPPPPSDGAAKYIQERNEKRSKGFDILKHNRYNPSLSKSETLAYAGVRQVDGQQLALLRKLDEIWVMPIDEATARRIQRLKIGDPITSGPKGLRKPPSRSR